MTNHAFGCGRSDSCGSGSRYERSASGGRLLLDSARDFVCALAEYMVFRRYMRKDWLFQRNLFWMKESENFSLCNRFAAVTRMEWVDHFSISFSSEMPMVVFAAVRSRCCTFVSVMNLVCPL